MVERVAQGVELLLRVEAAEQEAVVVQEPLAVVVPTAGLLAVALVAVGAVAVELPLMQGVLVEQAALAK